MIVAVAEQGSVTRAAASLHQSSSAISHTLLGLETELGVDLFHRLPRGMALTDAGAAFVEAARRALHEAEVARTSVDAIRGLVTGQVSVAAWLGFSVALADLIGDFARRYPDVIVRVFPPESTDGVTELVRSGACGVGFTLAGAVPDMRALPRNSGQSANATLVRPRNRSDPKRKRVIGTSGVFAERTQPHHAS